MRRRRSDNPEVRAALETLSRALETSNLGPTVGECWSAWWAAEGAHLRSADDLDSRWRNNLQVFWRGIPAESTRSADVVAYRAKRLQEVTRRDGPPSPATLNREIASLKRALTWAVSQGLIAANPLAHVALLPERNVRRTHLRGEKDLARLLAACDRRLRALVLLLFDSGLRRMEALRLRWDEIALVHDRAVVELAGTRTKNGEPRRVGLTARAWAALKRSRKAGDWVFPSRDGDGPVDARWMARLFERAVEDSGLRAAPGERITLHTLRHSFAYAWRVEHRISEAAVMRQGGWKTRSAFQRYGISDDHEAEAALELVESCLSRKGPHKATRNSKSEGTVGRKLDRSG